MAVKTRRCQSEVKQAMPRRRRVPFQSNLLSEPTPVVVWGLAMDVACTRSYYPPSASNQVGYGHCKGGI
jgi:hypothetical protein